MPMYNLLEYTKKEPETSESFWQYHQKGNTHRAK